MPQSLGILVRAALCCTSILVACQSTGHSNAESTSHNAASLTPGSTSSSAPVSTAWTQLGPAGTLIARVLTSDSTCPVLSVDGVHQTMQIRAAPSTTFPILTCELSISLATQQLSLGSTSLPLLKASPKVIAVIGDTGCEIKASGDNVAVQNCNDPSGWPFAKVASTLAGMHPDLIIHVGDYHYREVACPTSQQSQCGGAQIGDTWQSWNQDFFTPAAPLLAAAPLLLARGNHELCARAGNGWFQFLDPRPWQACTDSAAPYWTIFGTHQVAIIDSANDTNMDPSFAQLQPHSAAPVWWVLHRPFLTPTADDELTGAPPTLPASWQTPGALQLVLTGHKHLMSLSNFTNGLPPELITGNGGTTLEKLPNSGQVLKLLQVPPARTIEYYDYGFLLFRDQGGGHWQISEYDRNGATIATCLMTETLGTQTALTCASSAGGLTL